MLCQVAATIGVFGEGVSAALIAAAQTIWAGAGMLLSFVWPLYLYDCIAAWSGAEHMLCVCGLLTSSR